MKLSFVWNLGSRTDWIDRTKQNDLSSMKQSGKHSGKRMSSTSKSEQPRKQPAPGGKIIFAYETFLCIIGTCNDCAARHHCIGVVKIIFQHVFHPNIYLQTDETGLAQRKEQKRAAEEAKTANAEKQVRLSVWIILVH